MCIFKMIEYKVFKILRSNFLCFLVRTEAQKKFAITKKEGKREEKMRDFG